MDNLDEVFGSDEAEPVAATEDAAPEPVESGQQEGEAPAEAPPRAEEPVRQEGGAGFVPIAVVLDEREKRQELQRRLDAYEAQQAKQQAPAAPEAPDPYDDPNGFQQHVVRQVDQARADMRFELSGRFAAEKYGEEAVKSATDWATERCKTDQAFAVSMMQQPDPIGWIVQQQERETLLAEIGAKGRDGFIRDFLAANPDFAASSAPAGAAVVPVAPKQAAPPVKVPRSLASQGSGPSDIRQTATGPLAAVDAVFP